MSETQTQTQLITGILVLSKNKTFGSINNGKKQLYKCILSKEYENLPKEVLVPYVMDIGFNKHFINKYVQVKIEQQQQYAMLTEVYGDVNSPEAYLAYELATYHLHIPKRIQTSILQNNNKIELPPLRETPEYIFSIDSNDTIAIDDALSITKQNNTVIISVYITNVAWHLQDRMQSVINVWENSPATIYLPTPHVKHMFPISYSSNWSLIQNTNRVTMVVHFEYDISTKEMCRIWYEPIVTVSIAKNHVYESNQLVMDDNYQSLLYYSKCIEPSITDSYQLVAYWMESYNRFMAQTLYALHSGIYLHIEEINNNTNIPNELSKETKCVIQYWKKHTIRKVVSYQELTNTNNLYVCATSPMRRLYDLINQYTLLSKTNIITYSLLKINQQHKYIKRLQLQSSVYLHCLSITNPRLEEYDAIIIGNVDDGKYPIFIPSLHILSSVTVNTEEIQLVLYETYKVAIYVFENENTYSKKIKIAFLR